MTTRRTLVADAVQWCTQSWFSRWSNQIASWLLLRSLWKLILPISTASSRVIHIRKFIVTLGYNYRFICSNV